MLVSEFGPIVQHGYVVDDVETSAAMWAHRVGAGPFYVFERVVLENYVYRGRLTEIELKIAIGYWSDVQIELITPIRDDGLYAQALRDEPGKLNHYAVYVSDLDDLMHRRALQPHVLQSGEMGDGLKFVYLGHFIPGGLHLEIIQAAPDVHAGMRGMAAVATLWDGARPVRPAGALADDLAAMRAEPLP